MARARLIFRNMPQIQKNLLKHIDNVEKVSHQIVDSNFQKAEGFAKEKAPWTDRTGNARNSIAAVDQSFEHFIAFFLIIGMEYGIWLELANQGKYRILLPTFQIYYNRIRSDFAKVGIKITVNEAEAL